MSVLKIMRSVKSMMCSGREGAGTEKALLPQVRCLVLCGGARKSLSEERRARDRSLRWSRPTSKKSLIEKSFPFRLSKAPKLLTFHLGIITILTTC